MEIYSAGIDLEKDRELLNKVISALVKSIYEDRRYKNSYVIENSSYNSIVDVVKGYYGEFVNLESLVHRYPDLFSAYGIAPRVKEHFYEMAFTYNNKVVYRIGE